MYHRGIEQSLLKGSAVVALGGSAQVPGQHGPLAAVRLLRERQPLKVVVLIHSLVLREARRAGKAATVKLGSLESSVVRLGRVPGWSTVIESAVVRV